MSWSRFVNLFADSRLSKIMTLSGAAQGVFLAEAWKDMDKWVFFAVAMGPSTLMSWSRVTGRPGIVQTIGAAAHLLLAVPATGYAVQMSNSPGPYARYAPILALFMVPGALFAIGILVLRVRDSSPADEATNIGTTEPSGPSNKPIE
jgi:hypothetical protein